MGGFDCYCAICGGPLASSSIFLKRLPKAQEGEGNPEDQQANGEIEDEEDEDEDESAYWDGDGDGYDANILHRRDIQWIKRVYCLGFNLRENENRRVTHSRAFWSGEGGYDGNFGCLHGQDLYNHSDPNSDPNSEYNCYANWGSNTDPVFPFHRPCMEILQWRINNYPHWAPVGEPIISASTLRRGNDYRDGQDGVEDDGAGVDTAYNEVVWNLDKDALYRVMLTFDSGRHLTIEYGEVSRENHQQFWESHPEKEYMVCRPLPANEYFDESSQLATAKLITTCLNREMPPVVSGSELVRKVKHDPFGKLPFDVLHGILELVPSDDYPTALARLARASLHVNLALRDVGPSFWLALYVRSMPWFFELHCTYINEAVTPDSLKERIRVSKLSAPQLRRLYMAMQWATSWQNLNWLLAPKDGKALPSKEMEAVEILGIANRRRVWGACEELAAAYAREIDEEEYVARDILEYSECPIMAEVAAPQERMNGLNFRSTYWMWSNQERLRMPEDGDEGGYVFAAHWDGDGHLCGMEFQPEGDESRMFGESGEGEDIIELERGDWIEGLVFHIPPPSEEGETCPKGLTVYLKSGQVRGFGEFDNDHWQRPFVSAPGHAITGAVGYVNERKIVRFGIVQVSWNDPEDQSGETGGDKKEDDNTQVGNTEGDNLAGENAEDDDDDDDIDHPASVCLWKHPHLDVLPSPIWSCIDIGMLYSSQEDEATRDVHFDMLPFEVMIWARDAKEARSLKAVSMNTIKDIDNDALCRILGMRAEFSGGMCEERKIGEWGILETPEEFKEEISTMQLDGPGGEMITEGALMASRKRGWPHFALQLKTNRGQKYRCGHNFFDDKEAIDELEWEVFTTTPDKVIVGVVVMFDAMDPEAEGLTPWLGSLRFVTVKRERWEKGWSDLETLV